MTPSRVIGVIAPALLGQVLTAVITIVLARGLSTTEFEAYVVAASVFLLFAALVPCGLDKFAIAFVSVATRERSQDAGPFVAFGARRTAVAAGAAAVLVALVALLLRLDRELLHAVLMSCVGLPAAALVRFRAGVLTGQGREIWSAVIERLLPPVLVLVAVVSVSSLPLTLSGATVIALWAGAWHVSLIALIQFERPSLGARFDVEIDLRRRWVAGGLPFLAYRGAVVALGQTSLISLGLLANSPAAVGAYAAALSITTPVLALMAALNRTQVRQIAVHVRDRNRARLVAIANRRMSWVIPVATVACVAAMIWAPRLIALFGPDYVGEGVTCLRILAPCAWVMAVLSLAPTYAKLALSARTVTAMVMMMALSQIILLVLLLPRFGATGAAAAYPVSMVALYCACGCLSRAHVARLTPIRPYAPGTNEGTR